MRMLRACGSTEQRCGLSFSAVPLRRSLGLWSRATRRPASQKQGSEGPASDLALKLYPFTRSFIARAGSPRFTFIHTAPATATRPQVSLSRPKEGFFLLEIIFL